MKLTARQMQVAELYAEGLDTREIAEKLGLKRHTIKIHLSHAYTKLAMRPRGPEPQRRDQQRIRLAMYWNCELFQIGLTA